MSSALQEAALSKAVGEDLCNQALTEESCVAWRDKPTRANRHVYNPHEAHFVCSVLLLLPGDLYLEENRRKLSNNADVKPLCVTASASRVNMGVS